MKKFIIAFMFLYSFNAFASYKDFKIVVYKSKRVMHLLCKSEVIKQYKISLGGNPISHKQKEGDNKTPEGIYKIDYRNPNSSYHKSLHISYPNSKDKKIAKQKGVNPGGMLMIHGLGKSFSYLGSSHAMCDWTPGLLHEICK